MEEQSPRPLMVERVTRRRNEGITGTLGVPLGRGGRRVWRFFTSVRLALILILVLTGLSLIGTLLIQVSPEVAADPGEYAWWLDNVVRPKLGIWTTLLAFLGLFDVFHSAWFLGTGSLLVVNIVVCSVNRWKAMRNALFSSRVKLADGFYEGGINRAQFANLEMTPQEAGMVVRRVLERRGNRVRQENTPDALYVAADKNRYFPLVGTYLHHGSVVLLILGFLLGSYLGFRNRAFMVPEGSLRDVGYGTNLSLELESFVDEYWPEGPPKDYRSQVVLYEDGVEVQRGLIRVNHAMSYKGVRFYQSSFGPAAVMEVRDQTGQLLYSDGVALGWLTGKEPYKRPTGMFSLPGTGATAYVLAPAQGYFDPLIQAGQMRVEVYRGRAPIAVGTLEPGVPRNLAGLEFTFVRERQFSGFQVTRDPGNMLIWIASGLFVLGLVMVFYFPHRQVWARVHTWQGGRTRLLVRTTSTRSLGVASDFESLAEELGKELSLSEKKG